MTRAARIRVLVAFVWVTALGVAIGSMVGQVATSAAPTPWRVAVVIGFVLVAVASTTLVAGWVHRGTR